MKKVMILLFAVTLFSFTTQEVKTLTVQATTDEWQKHINKLEVIRQIADESNLNNQQVKFITRSIDSLEMLIIPQLRKQLADTIKKK